MWRCDACGQWQRQVAPACGECGKGPIVLVPGNPATKPQLNFLASEMGCWRRWEWISSGQYQHLIEYYRPLWEQANGLALDPVPAVPTRPSAAPVPDPNDLLRPASIPHMQAVSPARVAPRRISRSGSPAASHRVPGRNDHDSPPRERERLQPAAPGPLAAILEESNITLWHAVGAILLVAGLTGLIRITWNGAGRYLVLALLLALTGGLYGLAQSRGLRDFKIGRIVLTAISALLAPLDVIAVSAARLFGLHLDFVSMGLAASLVSLPFYALLWRRVPGRTFVAFFAADAAVSMHFLLQDLFAKPGGGSGAYHFYGFGFPLLAGLYFALARRTAAPERRRLLTISGHLATFAGIAAALMYAPSAGEMAGVFACIAVVYLLAAALLSAAPMLMISACAGLIGAWCGVLRVQTHGVGWAGYSLAAYGVAAVYALAASRLKTVSPSLAEIGRKAAEVQFGLGLIPMSAVFLSGAMAFPSFWPSHGDLLRAIGIGGAAAGVYRLLWRAAAARWCASWVFLLTLSLLCETCLPHRMGKLAADSGLLLSLTALFARWGLKDRMIFGVLSLAGSALTVAAMIGGLHVWPADAALVTLIVGGIFDLRESDAEDDTSIGLEVWWLLALAVGLTLHWETRFLPWAHRRFGLEPNFGYGLAVLVAVCMALRDRWSGDRLAVAGRLLGLGATVLVAGVSCLQVVLALQSGAVYSPVALLEILVAIEAVNATVRRSETSAAAALILQAVCSGVWAFQRFEHPPSHLFDLIGIAIFAFGAVSLAVPARRLPMQPLRAGVVFFLYAVYVQTILTLFHPDAVALAFWMTPLTVLASGAAFSSSGALNEEWRTAIRQCCYTALAVTTLIALGSLVDRMGQPGAGSPLALLSLNAIFVSVIAAIRRSEAAANGALAMQALCSVLWIVERCGPPASRPSDILGIAMLISGSLNLAALGHHLRLRSVCLGAVILGYASVAQIAVTVFHPGIVALCFWMMAFTAVLYALSVMAGKLWWTAIEPCCHAALAITTLAGLSSVIASVRGADGGLALGLLCFNSAFVAAIGVLRRDGSLLVASAVFANAVLYFAIRRYAPPASGSFQSLLFGLAGPVWLLVSLAVNRDGWFGDAGRRSIRHVAAMVAGLSCLMALASIRSIADADVIVSLLIAGCVFATRRVAGDGALWQHAAFAAFTGAYACFLSRTIGPPAVAIGDAYLAPVGLYLIALGAFGQRRSSRADYRILLACGLLFLMTPSLLAAMFSAGDIAHALLLVTESVLAIWYGLANRIRVAAGIGTAFLFAVISSQMHGYATHIHWAVYATMLGLAIIGNALLLERRREDVLRLKKRVETYFQEWD